MTNEKREILEKLAKGEFQRSVLYDLLNGHEIRFSDYMDGTTYYSSYIRSFSNLISRMEKSGLKIEWKPGKLGGFWSSTAKIIN